MKFINNILWNRRNCKNSQILLSMSSPRRSSTTMRRLLWNYLEDFKNYRMKWIVWMIPGILWMLSRFAVEIHTLPVHLDCSLDILHFKDYWRQPSCRSDKLRSRQMSGIHPVYQETFLHTDFFISSVSSGIEFYLEENYWRTNSHVYSGQKWNSRTRPRSEMPVWTVRLSPLQWRKLFKELWGRPTTIADFGFSFWQVPYASNFLLVGR